VTGKKGLRPLAAVSFPTQTWLRQDLSDGQGASPLHPRKGLEQNGAFMLLHFGAVSS